MSRVTITEDVFAGQVGDRYMFMKSTETGERMRIEVEVDVCEVCGALTLPGYEERHRSWHERLSG